MTHSNRPSWTDTEAARLRTLVDAGKTDAEIAIELDRPRSSIGMRRRQLGLAAALPPGRPRSFNAAKVDAIRSRIAAGESVRQVAADLGMQPSNVYWRLRMVPGAAT